jgi:hypothetical protein
VGRAAGAQHRDDHGDAEEEDEGDGGEVGGQLRPEVGHAPADGVAREEAGPQPHRRDGERERHAPEAAAAGRLAGGGDVGEGVAEDAGGLEAGEGAGGRGHRCHHAPWVGVRSE